MCLSNQLLTVICRMSDVSTRLFGQFFTTKLGEETDTYSPLNTQKPEQECDPVVPATCLVDEALAAKDIGSTVHFASRSLRKKDDDSDCKNGHLVRFYGLELQQGSTY